MIQVGYRRRRMRYAFIIPLAGGQDGCYRHDDGHWSRKTFIIDVKHIYSRVDVFDVFSSIRVYR